MCAVRFVAFAFTVIIWLSFHTSINVSKSRTKKEFKPGSLTKLNSRIKKNHLVTRNHNVKLSKLPHYKDTIF